MTFMYTEIYSMSKCTMYIFRNIMAPAPEVSIEITVRYGGVVTQDIRRN